MITTSGGPIWDTTAAIPSSGPLSGPVVTGTDVTLRLRAASGDLTAAKVRLWNDRTTLRPCWI